MSTRCNGTNICECQSGYIPSRSGQYCKQQPILGTLYSLLGEECDGVKKLCVDINTVCNTSANKPVCVCNNGFRRARKEEKNAYPFNIVQCVPNEFKLDLLIT
ncbi:hypothetical protein KUTeg_023922 [Tegillarca granosa]|uniref:EGF-like domain-containing protein n=1 Tax=Tegillarca granosa TaxID=220873 RepID=A0ABQ9DYX1_TEGGR|nr:hypothetical protein KUTeg_023922 [Tegillarca granosa]